MSDEKRDEINSSSPVEQQPTVETGKKKSRKEKTPKAPKSKAERTIEDVPLSEIAAARKSMRAQARQDREEDSEYRRELHRIQKIKAQYDLRTMDKELPEGFKEEHRAHIKETKERDREFEAEQMQHAKDLRAEAKESRLAAKEQAKTDLADLKEAEARTREELRAAKQERRDEKAEAKTLAHEQKVAEKERESADKLARSEAKKVKSEGRKDSKVAKKGNKENRRELETVIDSRKGERSECGSEGREVVAGTERMTPREATRAAAVEVKGNRRAAVRQGYEILDEQDRQIDETRKAEREHRRELHESWRAEAGREPKPTKEQIDETRRHRSEARKEDRRLEEEQRLQKSGVSDAAAVAEGRAAAREAREANKENRRELEAVIDSRKGERSECGSEGREVVAGTERKTPRETAKETAAVEKEDERAAVRQGYEILAEQDRLEKEAKEAERQRRRELHMAETGRAPSKTTEAPVSTPAESKEAAAVEGTAVSQVASESREAEVAAAETTRETVASQTVPEKKDSGGRARRQDQMDAEEGYAILDAEKRTAREEKEAERQRRRELHQAWKDGAGSDPKPTAEEMEELRAHHSEHLKETKEKDAEFEARQRADMRSRSAAAVAAEAEHAEEYDAVFAAAGEEEARTKAQRQADAEAAEAARLEAKESKAAEKAAEAARSAAEDAENADRRQRRSEGKVASREAKEGNRQSRTDVETACSDRMSEGQGYLESAGREVVPGTERKTPRQASKETADHVKRSNKAGINQGYGIIAEQDRQAKEAREAERQRRRTLHEEQEKQSIADMKEARAEDDHIAQAGATNKRSRREVDEACRNRRGERSECGSEGREIVPGTERMTPRQAAKAERAEQPPKKTRKGGLKQGYSILRESDGKIEQARESERQRRRELHESWKAEAGSEPAPTEEQLAHMREHQAETRERDAEFEAKQMAEMRARSEAAVAAEAEHAEEYDAVFAAAGEEEAHLKAQRQADAEAAEAARLEAKEARAAEKAAEAERSAAEDAENADRRQRRAEGKAASKEARAGNRQYRTDVETACCERMSDGQGYLESTGREVVPGTERKTPRQASKETAGSKVRRSNKGGLRQGYEIIHEADEAERDARRTERAERRDRHIASETEAAEEMKTQKTVEGVIAQGYGIVHKDDEAEIEARKAERQRRRQARESWKDGAGSEPAPTEEQLAHMREHQAETRERDAEFEARQMAERRARSEAAVAAEAEHAEEYDAQFDAAGEAEDRARSDKAAAAEKKRADKVRAKEAKEAEKKAEAERTAADKAVEAERRQKRAEGKVASRDAKGGNRQARDDVKAASDGRMSEGQGYLESAGREVVEGTGRKTPRQASKEKSGSKAKRSNRRSISEGYDIIAEQDRKAKEAKEAERQRRRQARESQENEAIEEIKGRKQDKE